MHNHQMLLNSILSKSIFEYLLVDEKLTIIEASKNVDIYLDDSPTVGNSILSCLPELVGLEERINHIWEDHTSSCVLEPVSKNGLYIKIVIEYYEADRLLLLIQNITDVTVSKQELLQYSNESLLLNTTLQNILDNQNAYIFVTHNEDIAFANKKFMTYFKTTNINELREKNLHIYKYLDHKLKSYDELFAHVNSKEEYIVINNDTFILQASYIELTHKLFTLIKITNLSNKLQFDPLTLAHKKEFFNKELEKLILLGEVAAVVVLDLDDFKKVNDTYGHQIGDEILQEFSALIQKNISNIDIFARWGGEEFLLLLKNTTLIDASDTAEKLCKLIENHSFKTIGNLTSSLGLAWISENDTLHSVLFRADKALYDAKNNGKNNVVIKMLKK